MSLSFYFLALSAFTWCIKAAYQERFNSSSPFISISRFDHVSTPLRSSEVHGIESQSPVSPSGTMGSCMASPSQRSTSTFIKSVLAKKSRKSPVAYLRPHTERQRRLLGLL